MTIDHYRAAWSCLAHPATKLVMLALAEHANAAGNCWPSVSRMAKTTGLHRATVMRVLSELEDAGLIVRTRSRGRSTRYQLVAWGDTSQDATSSTVRQDLSHDATGLVAWCDLTSRMVRHEPRTEALTTEPPREPIRELSIEDVD